MIIILVLLPIIGGVGLSLFRERKESVWQIYVMCIVLANAVLTITWLCIGSQDLITLIRFTDSLSISLRIDAMSKVFAGLVSVLWPLATLYAFEYMEHEEGKIKFFSFYTMTYGITLALAFSANLVTYYLFYELLTFVTLPLVMHEMDKRAFRAGRKYLLYSVSGAGLVFVGLAILIYYSGSTNFALGGITAGITGDSADVMRIAYLLTFLGFGVKAAVFPMHGWLPTAAVAPTPVTALLHAVAVVKAGAFGIIRVTYFCFGTELLRGSWVQYTVMAMALVTILFGSSMAVAEKHLKRRLAYSTISNLSYIVFGATMMTDMGLTASLSHLVFHAVMKICLFLCVGALLCYTGKEYIYDFKGISKKMPFVSFCFSLSSLALIGVPPMVGFISKWNLATAAIDTGDVLAYIGVGVLMVSSVLTAVYLFSIVVTAYYKRKKHNIEGWDKLTDPGWKMKLPLALLCAAAVILGLFSEPLMKLIGAILA